MAYQYVREPLLGEEYDQLCNACESPLEKMCVWTLGDTGLRVSELCGLKPANILWQQRAFRVKGKGGPFGKQSKARVVPFSNRVRALIEPHFALHQEFPVGERRVQKLVKDVANRAKISREVTPHVLRHTFATLFLQKGGSLAALSRILGHDRLETTAIYLNLTDMHVLEEYAAKW
ncbi:MAG: Tyrosine recombinase XerC [Phycisphaerae bacterium]|nr:Tyrosine recombinase XerC [Phycisphaerae bacterium]